MKITKFLRVVAICAFATTLFSITARANDFITAYGWVTTSAITGSATGASAASLALGTCHNGAGACTLGNADVTFTTSGVNFDTFGSDIATWVASNTFPVNNLVDTVGSSQMADTIWFFTGNISVGSPQPFTIEHDDGATFIINGQTVIGAAGPTPPIPTMGTYTGPASTNAPFELYYTECCGGPAVLSVDLLGPQNAPVSEPSSLAILGTGFVSLAGLIRRRLTR